MAARDSGISGIESMSIAFPTPDNASEKHSSRNKDNYKKPTKQPIEKSSFARVRDRAKTLSNTPPSTLVKLLLHEESTTRKTHQLLTQAVDRLGTASERATNAETSRRATEVQALLEKTKRDQELAAANDEARRAKNELEIYKLQLRRAQDEALRTQKTMKVLTERQVAAERNAAQARSLARKYRGRNLMMIAKEEGKLEGYREGLRAGREIIGAKYNLQEYEIQDGGSAFIEEYFEDAEGTTTAHSTPYSQSRRMSRKDETRKQRDTGSHTPRQMTTDGHPRSTPRPQPQPDLPTSSNGTQTSPATVLQAVQSPQPAPLPMTPPLISISAQQLSPTISASPISPHPRSLQPHSPIQGNDSSRAAGVPFPDPIVEPTPHPQQVAVEEPEVINIRRPSSSNSTPQALGPPVFSHSPTQSYTSPTAQILPHSSPSQASHTSSPLAENNVLGVLEYVPMPAPPISMPNTESQTTAEIQAPLPSSGPQNPEADRQREVDVSTPSTMTGIAGLATFPSYVPTASSDGTDQVPGVAGSAGSAGGGHRPPSATGSRAGSVRSVGSGDPWPGGTSRRRNLSTIYEQSREGTPGLTPMHTGNSLQSVRSQVRVDEWRRSLSQSGGTETPRSEIKPLSPMHSGSSLYAPGPPPSLVSQDTGLTNLRRRRSSSSGKTASINIQVEPPSRSTSDGRRTPVPGSGGGHGHTTPQYPPFYSGYTNHFTESRQQQPGYLSPNRSPLDLAPVQSTEPGPNDPPVIPGMTPKLAGMTGSPSMVPGVSNNGTGIDAQGLPPHIYASGQFPPGFVPTYVQPSPKPRAVSLQSPRRLTSPVNSDDSEEESTTSSRRDLMKSLYKGNGASNIPPGAVTGGTPQVTWKPSTPTGATYETWPPNSPLLGSASISSSHNPLPKPPESMSGGTSFGAWGGTSLYAPSTSGNSPYVPRGAAAEGDRSRSPAPVPIPNATLGNTWGAVPRTSSTSTSNGTPRVAGSVPSRIGMMSPSLVSSLDRTLPPDPDVDVSPRTKRASLHAGTTPLFKGKTIPSLSGSGSGRSSRNGSEEDTVLDAQTQENTVANAKMVRMGERVQVGVNSPYRPPAAMPLYRG